jgi:hypothetical protein
MTTHRPDQNIFSRKTFAFQLTDISISIIFVGDICFNGCVEKFVHHGYNDYNDTMVKVAGIIREADIAVGNLESPFATKTMLKDRFNGLKEAFMYSVPRSVAALQ